MAISLNPFRKVSETPTNPQPVERIRQFDVADLYRGPVAGTTTTADTRTKLDERLRPAYFWIVNQAVIRGANLPRVSPTVTGRSERRVSSPAALRGSSSS
jgi:hypothetical protein